MCLEELKLKTAVIGKLDKKSLCTNRVSQIHRLKVINEAWCKWNHSKGDEPRAHKNTDNSTPALVLLPVAV